MSQQRAARLSSVVAVLCLAALTASLSFYQLDRAPMHLTGDEAQFAVQAQSLAASGRDLNGRVLPLFVNVTDPLAPERSSSVWFQPMLFYFVAAALELRPIDEWTIRAPLAAIAAIDVVLLYLLARRIFPRPWHAAAAAALLIVTPTHLIFSRVTSDYLCSVPFIIGWLMCLVIFLETGRRPWLLAAGGLLLGIAFYSYIASWIMMPLYLLLTLVLVWKFAERPIAAAIAATAGVAAALAIFAAWLWTHPGMLYATLSRYGITSAAGMSTRALGWRGLLDRVSVYWDYFNPAYLFLAGGTNPIDSTRRVGVLLAPMAPLLVAGVVYLWRDRTRPLNLLLLVGLAASPVAAVALNERYCSDRELFLLPFAVLVSTFGLSDWLSRRGALRWVAIACCLAMPVQFAAFYDDYLHDYRARVAGRFDPFDFRAIADAVIAADASQPAPVVYLSPRLDYAAYRWRFYMLKHGQEPLFSRTRYLDADTALPANSLVVVPAHDALLDAPPGSPRFVVTRTIADADGSPLAVIVRIAA